MLEQRVLWTYDETITINSKLPSNVLVCPQLSLNEILRHRNVTLFMTRGSLSEQEAGLLHGRPMLMIPFHGDQYRTAIKSVVAGYASLLQFSEVTATSVHEKLNELLCDKRFGTCARDMSRMHRSRRLADSNDVTKHWCTHAKMHATVEEMPWHMDILGALFLVIIIVVKIITAFTRIFHYDDENDDTNRHTISKLHCYAR